MFGKDKTSLSFPFDKLRGIKGGKTDEHTNNATFFSCRNNNSLCHYVTLSLCHFISKNIVRHSLRHHLRGTPCFGKIGAINQVAVLLLLGIETG